MSKTELCIRLDLANGNCIGPGKIALLEAIQAKGSITAAARHLGMCYRRAWLLVQDINGALREPAVTRRTPWQQRRGGDLSWRGGHQALSLDRKENAYVSTSRVFGDR